MNSLIPGEKHYHHWLWASQTLTPRREFNEKRLCFGGNNVVGKKNNICPDTPISISDFGYTMRLPLKLYMVYTVVYTSLTFFLDFRALRKLSLSILLESRKRSSDSLVAKHVELQCQVLPTYCSPRTCIITTLISGSLDTVLKSSTHQLARGVYLVSRGRGWAAERNLRGGWTLFDWCWTDTWHSLHELLVCKETSFPPLKFYAREKKMIYSPLPWFWERHIPITFWTIKATSILFHPKTSRVLTTRWQSHREKGGENLISPIFQTWKSGAIKKQRKKGTCIWSMTTQFSCWFRSSISIGRRMDFKKNHILLLTPCLNIHRHYHDPNSPMNTTFHLLSNFWVGWGWVWD